MKTQTAILAHEDWAKAEGLQVKATRGATVLVGKVTSAYKPYIFIEISDTIGFSIRVADGWIVTYEKKIQTFMEAFDDAPIGTVWRSKNALGREKIIKVDSNRYFSSLSEMTHDVALNAWSREPASNYYLTDKPQG